MAYARARRMAVSRLYPRCAGRRRGARGLPGVGKQGNKPRRSGYPKVSTSVEPFSSYLTSELCCRFFPRVHPRSVAKYQRSVPHHLVGTSGLVTTRST